MPMNESELLARDAKRDIGAELLQSVREMKAGLLSPVELPAVASVRMKTGLSQSEFARLLAVSVRTLQGWEQGRRTPAGAARTLLRIADKHPEYLKELGV